MCGTMDVLKGILDAAGLEFRPMYTPAEVCRMLQISRTTFGRLCDSYQPGGLGESIRPEGLHSIWVGKHRRVSVASLMEFIESNNDWSRLAAAS